jgi:hypothetical protein
MMFLAMVLGVMLCRKLVMLVRMKLMPVCDVGVMRRRLMIIGEVSLVSFLMMMGGAFEVQGGLLVVIVL